MDTLTPSPLRLTEFSHGGGCGCKISPSVLRDILAGSSQGLIPPDLLVGIETADDAAVYRINGRQAIVATTDFFMPIVDDPFDFGAIAAANALSDLYAMGATPLFALAVLGMPVGRLPVESIRRILEGGESICAKAGIAVAGGHSIDSIDPIYGLVAIGLVAPENIKRNRGARADDVLILGKPLGVGIYSAALKKQQLPARDYETMMASATQLNTPGISLGGIEGVHALTDVTGFGLLGHLLEICRASSVGAEIAFERVPLLPDVVALVKHGHVTGASGRNWASYGGEVDGDLDDLERTLLTDPQTSGGLLVACPPAVADEVLGAFSADGFDRATVVGRIVSGPPRVLVHSGAAAFGETHEQASVA